MNWLDELVTEYRSDPSKVNMFGVVLYTDSHPHIKKVLRDCDFWLALNELSGPDWAIFSIRPKQGTYSMPDFYPEPGVFYQLVQVWKEPQENKELLEYFGIESTKRLPLLIVFTHDENNEILKIEWELDDSTVDTSYKSLSTGIKTVREAINNVDPRYKKYANGLYRAINGAIGHEKNITKIKKGIDFFSYLKSLLT